MSLYDEMQKVVSSILSNPDFRQGNVVLLRMVAGSGFPADPGKAVVQRYPVDAVVASAANTLNRSGAFLSGAIIASDLAVTFAPIAVEPALTDFIEVDGKRFKIVYIDRKPAAGVAVAFTVVVRR